jgi:hypothetical protein
MLFKPDIKTAEDLFALGKPVKEFAEGMRGMELLVWERIKGEVLAKQFAGKRMKSYAKNFQAAYKYANLSHFIPLIVLIPKRTTTIKDVDGFTTELLAGKRSLWGKYIIM